MKLVDAVRSRFFKRSNNQDWITTAPDGSYYVYHASLVQSWWELVKLDVDDALADDWVIKED